MASAYYRRNNSYSRSFNAELAEIDGRLPLTRFCDTYGLKNQLVNDIGTEEWHHVGKYANCVDYYDWRNFVTKFDALSRAKPRPDQLAARRIAIERYYNEQTLPRLRPQPVSQRCHKSQLDRWLEFCDMNDAKVLWLKCNGELTVDYCLTKIEERKQMLAERAQKKLALRQLEAVVA